MSGERPDGAGLSPFFALVFRNDVTAHEKAVWITLYKA